jgi:hypothetical protein
MEYDMPFPSTRENGFGIAVSICAKDCGSHIIAATVKATAWQTTILRDRIGFGKWHLMRCGGWLMKQ